MSTIEVRLSRRSSKVCLEDVGVTKIFVMLDLLVLLVMVNTRVFPPFPEDAAETSALKSSRSFLFTFTVSRKKVCSSGNQEMLTWLY